jgi:hypothetical protein
MEFSQLTGNVHPLELLVNLMELNLNLIYQNLRIKMLKETNYLYMFRKVEILSRKTCGEVESVF